jgi:hypothetical protein
MRRIPRPSPATVIASIALIVAIGGTAYATGEGQPLLGGARNPGNDTSRSLTKETQIIATTSKYGTRQSNKSSTGGGAIYGCRSGAGGTATSNEPCIRANNLSAGLAFEFVASGGSTAGLIQTKDATGKPFTTNATGVATGLNADRVDSLDADQIVNNARAGLVPLAKLQYVGAAAGVDEAAGRAAAPQVPLAQFGPFTVYGKCFVITAAPRTVRAEIFISSTQDQAILESPADDLDGNPAYLNTGTAESERQVQTTAESDANDVNLDLIDQEAVVVQADGTAFDFTVPAAAKNGALPGGDGPWGGAGDRCGFGFSRFSAG